MEKIIPNGTEVLIFMYTREWEFNKDDRFTEYNDTLYYHISPAPSILCNIFYNCLN